MASDKYADDRAHSHLPWIDEQPDQSRRALDVGGWRAELRDQLVAGQAGRQFFRIEIGGDENECIVVRRGVGRRAWTAVGADAEQALAADIFIRLFADFALGKAGDA